MLLLLLPQGVQQNSISNHCAERACVLGACHEGCEVSGGSESNGPEFAPGSKLPGGQQLCRRLCLPAAGVSSAWFGT